MCVRTRTHQGVSLSERPRPRLTQSPAKVGPKDKRSSRYWPLAERVHACHRSQPPNRGSLTRLHQLLSETHSHRAKLQSKVSRDCGGVRSRLETANFPR